MKTTTLRARAGNGAATRQRSVAAAARAAAKRADKAQRSAQGIGRVITVEPPQVEEPRRDEGERTAERQHRSGILSAVLAVLVVAGLVVTATLGWHYREAERTRQARTQALAVVRDAAPVILSYDYRHLDKDFAAANRYLTGSFREEYGKTTTTLVAPTARKYQGVVKATVAKPPAGGPPAVSVVSGSPDKVVVLLFMNQVTTSTKVSGPRLDLNRVRMTLTRTDQGWKVSAVDAL
ncbi:hypothetical protein [Streptomyces sp. SID13588]|uniref:hypothetical protein n=1 Tax=Streptomyces sp. SID13588 TaxID=2706051 RepID=UPI0013CBF673|nr:hypothetical protein [Streptomyces sp. SID13588]NEA76179.1 hypothetical protein [Streptomyces sp. SID13588]